MSPERSFLESPSCRRYSLRHAEPSQATAFWLTSHDVEREASYRRSSWALGKIFPDIGGLGCMARIVRTGSEINDGAESVVTVIW